MRINFNNERILQLLIISVCLIILTVRVSTESSRAQTPCPIDQPPLLHDLGTPQKSAWRQGTNVSVKYYDRTNNNPTDSTEITAVSNSIKDWNNRGCSNVTFGNAQPTGVAWDGSNPPANEMWVVRTTDRSGQLKIVGSFLTGMTAALLYMHSDYNLRTRDHFMRVDNLAKHEASHSFGMGNCTALSNNPRAVVCQNSFTIIPGGNYVITQCDIEGINRVYCPAPSPTPTPSPTATPYEEEECDGLPAYNFADFLSGDSDLIPDPYCCNNIEAAQCMLNGGTWIPSLCTCVSPIVIDVEGNGFDLTNAQNGVLFDITNNGSPMQIAWTSANSDDAWLALDRNDNGTIDNGRELFGSSSPQPRLQQGETKNGFRALAVFDRPQRGGNNDGRIDSRDAVYADLKLWQDINHNGSSEANELHGISELGLRIIDLDYRETRRQDEHGNWFRFRAKVKDAQGAQIGRWAWDVFLKVDQ